MPSHLNTQVQFDAIPARTVYRRLPDMHRNTSQSSTMDLYQIATIRRSAEYKLRLENVKQDHDLRHVLGHLTILDRVDEEIVRSAQPTPVVSLPLLRSQSQQKLRPLEIEVCETDVSPNMDDDNDSDSSIDDDDDVDDDDDFNFGVDEENDSDYTLVRV